MAFAADENFTQRLPLTTVMMLSGGFKLSHKAELGQHDQPDFSHENNNGTG